jgi:hypothetical protein
MLAGGGLVALALEILSLVNGRGELFSRLF